MAEWRAANPFRPYHRRRRTEDLSPVRPVKNKALEARERSISYFFVRLVRCIEATERERIDERCKRAEGHHWSVAVGELRMW